MLVIVLAVGVVGGWLVIETLGIGAAVAGPRDHPLRDLPRHGSRRIGPAARLGARGGRLVGAAAPGLGHRRRTPTRRATRRGCRLRPAARLVRLYARQSPLAPQGYGRRPATAAPRSVGPPPGMSSARLHGLRRIRPDLGSAAGLWPARASAAWARPLSGPMGR